MKTIFTICKKELKRFFTDPRMLFSLFFPGILMFIIYTAIGGVVTDSQDMSDTVYNVITINEPVELKSLLDNDMLKVNRVFNDYTEEEIKNLVKTKEIDLYIKYEEDFIKKVNEYNYGSGTAPRVEIYHTSANLTGQSLYSTYLSMLNAFEGTLTNKFDINPSVDINYDLASQEDVSMQMISMILPFILIVFLFSGAMSICADSVAGEKERGTIATLLITPVKRSYLAIGKITALGITSLASSVVSFLGFMFSIPKLVGGSFTLSTYSIGTMVAVFLVIIVTVLFFTTILTIVSTYAKSVKEASSLSVPLMVIVTMIGLFNFMVTTTEGNWLLYLIPVFNTVQCLIQLFTLNVDPVCFIVCILSNTVYIGIGVYLLTVIFNNEKIIFNK